MYEFLIPKQSTQESQENIEDPVRGAKKNRHKRA